jgi:hypothetical protein
VYYFIGAGIFAFIAILCVVAFFVQRKRRREFKWDN